MASRLRSRPSRRSRWAHLPVVALLAVAGSSLAAPARAEPQPSAADKESARSLMDQGTALEDSKDYAGALKAYKAAHALVGAPVTGVAVARVLAMQGLLVEALDAALAVGRIPKKPSEPVPAAKAREEAEALADKLPPRIPSVQVIVERAALGGSRGGAPESTSVSIDGVTLPQAAAQEPRKVNPGHHTVAATATGYLEGRVEVTVSEGVTLPVTLTLKPDSSSEPQPVTPKPGAGSAAPSGGLSPLVFIGFGVGAVGLGVGAVTGFLTLKRSSSIGDQCNNNICPGSVEGDLGAAKTLANVSNISFGVGLAGVGVGVVGVLLSVGSKGTEATPIAGTSLRVLPAVGPGGAFLTGTF